VKIMGQNVFKWNRTHKDSSQYFGAARFLGGGGNKMKSVGDGVLSVPTRCAALTS
jgi:hypothetical protein